MAARSNTLTPVTMYSRIVISWLPRAALVAFCVCAGAACARADADPFRFPPQTDRKPPDASEDARQRPETAAGLVSAACRRQLKNRRILLLVGEREGDQWLTSQDRYQPLFQVIENHLRALGFQLFTPEQIKASIAQGEIDAYFKNDPDAALAASKKLGADYILRGTISSRTGVNPVVQVNEVAVNIEMTLSALDGRTVSDVDAHADSYSGADTLRTATALVREQADRLVGRLAGDYCRQAVTQH